MKATSRLNYMNLGKESETIEFKKSTSELKEGVISLSSMLNKTGKAFLYFGVRNDGEVVGQQMGEDTERKISEAISNAIEPSVIPTINEKESPDGRKYVEVVAEGVERPYSAYGMYYIRSADQDKRATRESLKKMFAASGFDFIMETKSNRQDLHFTQLVSLLASKGLHITSQSAFIKNEKLVTGEGKFNQMAELLSDESDASIKVVRFSGKDKTAISQRKEFGGKCLILAMQLAMDYVESINETKVDMSKPQRVDIPLFDFQAFKEAWINACLHNSWNDLTPPAVYIFTDRIEIISYGGLPLGLSTEDFFQGDSHPVNKALQTIFTQLDYTEQTGHGVPVIVKAYGRDAFHISENFINVTIPYSFVPEWAIALGRPNDAVDSLNSTQKNVLDYLRSAPSATSDDVAKATGVSVSSIKKIFMKLKELGLIKRDGSNRKGRWTF
jgi:Predicted transcriptional regulator containing an HTH domain and an uncharacterized domain shared with the mammalian protein Schlafen